MKIFQREKKKTKICVVISLSFNKHTKEMFR